MRVWVLTNEYEGDFIGGLGVVATQLSSRLAAYRDMDVTVICKGPQPSVTIERKNGVTAIRVPHEAAYHFIVKGSFHMRPIVEWLEAHGYKKPDLIHIHSLQSDKLARYYKKKYHTPVIYTCHSLVRLEPRDRRPRNQELRQLRLFLLADAITVPSSWLKRKIRQVYPYLKKRVMTIPNGVTAGENAYIGYAGGFEAGYANPNRLLFVGRLQPVKGIVELLRAVSLLKKQNPYVKLDIVGKGTAAFTDKLKRLVRRLEVEDNVNWLGKLNPQEVQHLYRSYSAVIVPSRHESFGLVAMEALGHGIPLVATRNGGLGSFVDQDNAAVIPKVKAASIADSIRQMWNSPSLTAKRARNGLATANRYRWSPISERYRELFAKFDKEGKS